MKNKSLSVVFSESGCTSKVVFNHNDMGTTLLLLVQWTILLSFYTFWLLALRQPDHRELSWIADLRGRLKLLSSKVLKKLCGV